MYRPEEYINILLELTGNHLELRDFLILLNLSKVPMINRQIAKLFWNHAEQDITCANRRLRVLEAHKYIKPVKQDKLTFFKLAKRGEKLLKLYYGIHVKYSRHNSNTVYSKHSMVITNFWINLKVACNGHKQVTIDKFYAEYNYRDKIKDLHCPDAVFILNIPPGPPSKKGGKLLYFLEIDRGTETIEALDNNLDKQFIKMIKFYPEYFTSGRFRETYGNFNYFRALIVTTTFQRANNIRHIISRRFKRKEQELFQGLLSIDQQFSIENFLNFMWISSMDKISPANILGYSWPSLDTEDKMRYCLLEDVII